MEVLDNELDEEVSRVEEVNRLVVSDERFRLGDPRNSRSN